GKTDADVTQNNAMCLTSATTWLVDEREVLSTKLLGHGSRFVFSQPSFR
ncbi:hypothetical protein LSAT2_016932, partial [Lamellibrachia satsuma]